MYDFRYFMIWYKFGKIKNRTKIKKTDLFDKLKTLLLQYFGKFLPKN